MLDALQDKSTTSASSTLTETGETIRHRGREFSICTTTDSRADSPYGLMGKKGGSFALMRNRTRPDHLFGVGLDTMKVLQGVVYGKGREDQEFGVVFSFYSFPYLKLINC